MVVSYLKNIQAEFQKEQSSVERRLNDYKLQLQENQEFIKVLEDEIDPNYESFTPREIHPKNKERILELKGKDEELRKAIEKEEQVYADCLKKTGELEAVLQEALQYEKLWVEAEEKRRREEEEKEKENSRTEFKSSSVINKLEFCSLIAELDPRRCKVELTEIVRQMKNGSL